MAMLAASLFIGPAVEATVRRLAWGAMLVIVGSAAGSAVWFTILQKWVIGAFCPYCMTAHITGLLLAVLVIWRVLMQFNDDLTEAAQTNHTPNAAMDAVNAAPVKDVFHVTPRRIIGPLPAISLVLVGLAFAGIMAAIQVVFIPPAVYVGGQSQDNLPAIDSYTVPLVGSPDADYVVTLLFDYKCPHCQQLHFMLNEVTRRYSGKLAFTLCPAPLESQCNPYIARDREEFKDSCELAKVSLAVWLADQEVFAAFENWMFSFESGDRWQPRDLDAARSKAIELVGQEKFNAARSDPWIERYMLASVQIYGNTIQGAYNAIPKLVFGSRWVIPEPYDADDLVKILQESLGVPSPQSTQ